MARVTYEQSQAEKALAALGWTAGVPGASIRFNDCTYLWADGSVQAGGVPRRVVLDSADDIFAPETEPLEAHYEYPVAWRLRVDRKRK